MRMFILIPLILVTQSSFVVAGDLPGQDAIEVFLKIQADQADTMLIAQITALVQGGYQRGGSTASFLGGGCGVAGCSSTYLVTTSYFQTDVNAQSTVVAAIVSGFFEREFEVLRILSRSEIEDLAFR